MNCYHGADHQWDKTGDRGRCTDYRCTRPGCPAVRTQVAGESGLNCPWHSRQMSSPCYPCAGTPWRYGSDWPRCENADRNALGDELRCCLYTGHSRLHEYHCPSLHPQMARRCTLPYGHPGDNHADSTGECGWIDMWIGPLDRKSTQERNRLY